MQKSLSTIGNYDHLPEDDRPWVGIGEMSEGQELFCAFKDEEVMRLHLDTFFRGQYAKDFSQFHLQRLEELQGR